MVVLGPQIHKVNGRNIDPKRKNGFKIVETWDNHSESLKNNLDNDFKGPEYFLGGKNLENKIDTCQTTVTCRCACEYFSLFIKLIQAFPIRILTLCYSLM